MVPGVVQDPLISGEAVERERGGMVGGRDWFERGIGFLDLC